MKHAEWTQTQHYAGRITLLLFCLFCLFWVFALPKALQFLRICGNFEGRMHLTTASRGHNTMVETPG